MILLFLKKKLSNKTSGLLLNKMDKLNIIIIDDITVAQVKSTSGPAGAALAFNKLEAKMNGLRGRKMYGIFYPQLGDYFASVKLDKDFPDDMGFISGIIPGGKYAKQEIKNWGSKVKEIGSSFEKLKESCRQNGYEIDDRRPSIEFYRSQKELFIMLPVK